MFSSLSSTFGLSVSHLYDYAGDTTASAMTAIIAANLVLVAYVIESIREEGKVKQAKPTECKKSQ